MWCIEPRVHIHLKCTDIYSLLVDVVAELSLLPPDVRHGQHALAIDCVIYSCRHHAVGVARECPPDAEAQCACARLHSKHPRPLVSIPPLAAPRLGGLARSLRRLSRLAERVQEQGLPVQYVEVLVAPAPRAPRDHHVLRRQLRQHEAEYFRRQLVEDPLFAHASRPHFDPYGSSAARAVFGAALPPTLPGSAISRHPPPSARAVAAPERRPRALY